MSKSESQPTHSGAISADEMRACEAKAIDSGKVTGLELMERAGQGVVEAIVEEWPALVGDPGRAVVLCGPGNNGGDGFVIARLLKERGWIIDTFLLGNAAKLPTDARRNYDRWKAQHPVQPLTDDSFLANVEAHPDITLYVDALFGTGLARPFETLKDVRRILNTCQTEPNKQVICVDIPSGMSADTGQYLGFDDLTAQSFCILGNLTVSFHRPKLGHLTPNGIASCGKLVVKDIGL